jgi:hypothetical protein
MTGSRRSRCTCSTSGPRRHQADRHLQTQLGFSAKFSLTQQDRCGREPISTWRAGGQAGAGGARRTARSGRGTAHAAPGARQARCSSRRASAPARTSLPGRFHPQLLDENRRDIGKSQSKWTDSKMETAGSPKRASSGDSGGGGSSSCDAAGAASSPSITVRASPSPPPPPA